MPQTRHTCPAFIRHPSSDLPLLLPTHSLPDPKGQMTPVRRSARLQKATLGTTSPRRRGAQRKRTVKVQPASPPSQDDDQADAEADPPSGETDPAKVNQPISAAIHPNLKNAWRVNKALPMCFIFDSVSPAHRFKRGIPFNEDGEFPEYTKEDSSNVTETDDDPPLMPYAPARYL